MGNAILSYCESEINQKLNFITIPSRYFIFSNENMYSIKAKGEPLIGPPFYCNLNISFFAPQTGHT